MPSADAVRAVLLKVGEAAARNSQSSMDDVFRRTKSRTYLFTRLRKQFPELTREEADAHIDAVRVDKAEDPRFHEAIERPTRPPNRGREPIDDPAWGPRLEKLRSLIDVPMTTPELFTKAKRELGWDKSFFQAAIAASDGRGILEYQPDHWMPSPTEERKVPKPNRVRVRKVQREIECLVGQSDEAKLVERQKSVNARRGIVLARIADQERDIRKRHREELKELLGPDRAELAKLERELQHVVDQISAGTTMREVPCEERFDYETGIVSVVRMDTKDIIERRPMAESERQLEFEGA